MALGALRRHPLSALIVLSTGWLVYREFSYNPYADPFGPAFVGDFLAINLQVLGDSIARFCGLDVGLWSRLSVAAGVNLAIAAGVEWTVARIFGKRSR